MPKKPASSSVDYSVFGEAIEDGPVDYSEFGEEITTAPSSKGGRKDLTLGRDPMELYSRKGQKRAGRQLAAGAARFFEKVGGIPHVPRLEQITSGQVPFPETEDRSFMELLGQFTSGGASPIPSEGIQTIQGPEQLNLQDRILQAIGEGAVSSPGLGIDPIRSILSAGGGQAGSELVGPKTGLALSLAPFGVPKADAGRPEQFKVIPKGAEQASKLETARKLGTSEKAIAPVFKSKAAMKVAAPFARRGKGFTKFEENLQKTVGEMYPKVEEAFAAEGAIVPGQKRALSNAFRKLRDTMKEEISPKAYKEAEKVLFEAEKKFLARGAKADALPKAHKYINRNLDWNTLGDKSVLQTAKAKQSIIEIMEEINPVKTKDFRNINEMYKDMKALRKTLEPGKVHNFISKAKGIPILKAIWNGKLLSTLPGTGAKIAAVELLREGVAQYIKRPQTQALLRKMAKNMSQDKIGAAEAIGRRIEKDLEKIYEEASKKDG